MSSSRSRVVRLLSALGIVTSPLLAQPAASGSPASLAAKVDQAFAAWNRTDTPGCAVGVSLESKPILARAYGMADLEHGIANTPDTIFEAGSVSKQFTAAAIALLEQQGKLSLDDPVRAHIKELPDYGAPLTIRHMLNHTSGLRDWGALVAVAGWPRGSRVHTHAHVLDVVSRQRALNFTPGAEYSYSNSGYNLSAILVARLSGTSFADFTQEQLFAPLGLHDTQWRDDFTRVVPRRAVAYTLEAGRARLEMPFENVHGNGGLLTTVRDLLAWNANLDEPKLGGRALVETLQARGRLNDGRSLDYAAGLVHGRRRGLAEISHSGATAGYRAFLTRFPERRLSVAVLCNAAGADAEQLAHTVADVYLGPSLAAAPTATAVTLDAAQLAARTGLFRNTREQDALRTVVDAGKLRLENGPSLTPLSATSFRIGDGATRIDFDVDPAGRTRGARLLLDNGEVVALESVTPARPTAQELGELTGEYRSDEAETTVRVELDGEVLVLRQRPDRTLRLRPTYQDGFAIENGHVRFIRDANGRVVEMSLRYRHLRDLRFQRATTTLAAR